MEGIENALPRAHEMNELLKQLRTNELTLEEYLTQCAYWGLKVMDDIYCRSLPSKPLEVIEYENLPTYKRERLTREFFADNPGVERYYTQKEWVIRQNKTNLEKLEKFKKYIPEIDTKSHDEIDEKILDFKARKEGF